MLVGGGERLWVWAGWSWEHKGRDTLLHRPTGELVGNEGQGACASSPSPTGNTPGTWPGCAQVDGGACTHTDS